MKTYGQYCPISKASEVLGERWSILLLRELLIGSHKFNELARGLPDMSRTLLTTRLRQFEAAGILERLDGEYYLTPAGEDLRHIVFGMGDWYARWMLTDPEPEELDPKILMWWGHSRINTDLLPDRRVLIEFNFSDHPQLVWILVDDLGPSVCLDHPGFEVDVTVHTDLITLTRLWNARQTMSAALAAGRISFQGPTALTRKMPKLLEIPHPSVMGTSPDAPHPHVYTTPPASRRTANAAT